MKMYLHCERRIWLHRMMNLTTNYFNADQCNSIIQGHETNLTLYLYQSSMHNTAAPVSVQADAEAEEFVIGVNCQGSAPLLTSLLFRWINFYTITASSMHY